MITAILLSIGFIIGYIVALKTNKSQTPSRFEGFVDSVTSMVNSYTKEIPKGAVKETPKDTVKETPKDTPLKDFDFADISKLVESFGVFDPENVQKMNEVLTSGVSNFPNIKGLTDMIDIQSLLSNLTDDLPTHPSFKPEDVQTLDEDDDAGDQS